MLHSQSPSLLTLFSSSHSNPATKPSGMYSLHTDHDHIVWTRVSEFCQHCPGKIVG